MVFREIEHTADRAIEIEAETLEGLFQEAVSALSTLYSGEEPVFTSGKTRKTIKITVQAEDLEGLLVGFLNEVIFHTERKRVLFTSAGVKIKGKNGKGYFLTAELFNGKISSLSEVKSATYHRLKVEERDGKWHTMIIFDV
ncbi:MAG: archease [Candidatus Omnitrophota bacterium]